MFPLHTGAAPCRIIIRDVRDAGKRREVGRERRREEERKWFREGEGERNREERV